MPLRFLCVALITVLLPAVAHPLELTARESGKRISITPTEVLTVALAGNPTTGYLWEPC